MSQRVLSIQSHVVFGYVGNKSATFPLQLLGFEVDALNTVNFSNHTGYSHFSGTRFSGEELKQIFEGIKVNGLAAYPYALTGYLGNASLVNATYDIIREVKELSPGLLYVLDPVLGDNGKLYVSPEVIPIYRDQLCSLADIITPNQTEAEFLTQLPISQVCDLKLVFKKFHDMGVKNVIMTSSNLTPEAESSSKTDQNLVYLFASQQTDNSSDSFYISYPHKDRHFTGTGDLFSALTLAWYQKATSNSPTNGILKPSPLGPLATACEYTVSTIQSVLDLTLLCPCKPSPTFTPVADSDAKVISSELRIIESRDRIIAPEVVHFAKRLEF